MNHPADLITILTALASLDCPISSADAESVTLNVTGDVWHNQDYETYPVTFTYAELLDSDHNDGSILNGLKDERWQEAKQAYDEAERARKAQRERDEAAARSEAKDRAELARLKAKYES